ncbi:MAG: T9SS type A sorting domain-containing protein [Bacteroidales bacterium]
MKKLTLLSCLLFIYLGASAQVFKQLNKQSVKKADIGYGADAAMQGSICVVGADGDNSRKGSLFVYYQNKNGNDSWGLQKNIKAEDLEAGSRCGGSVSLSGDYIIAGATGVNKGAGAAYIFNKNEGGNDNWGQVKKLIPSSTNTKWYYGSSVSILNNTAAVGSKSQDGGVGAVYIYEKDKGGDNNWGESQLIKAPQQKTEGSFGEKVLLYGNRLFVGASSDGKNATGLVYVYIKFAGSWSLQTTITPSESFDNALFGWSIAVKDDYLAVGAIHHNGNGAVFVYKKENGKYKEIKKIDDPVSQNYEERFGYSLNFYKDYLLIGSPSKEDHGDKAGAVLVYSINNDKVTAAGEVPFPKNDVLFEGFNFGKSIATADQYLVVPVPNYYLNYSLVYFFKQDNTGIASITSKDNSVKIYPNPVSSLGSINIDSKIKDGSFSIIDLNGKNVSKEIRLDDNGQGRNIQLPNLPKGTYFIQIKSNNESISETLIIK